MPAAPTWAVVAGANPEEFSASHLPPPSSLLPPPSSLLPPPSSLLPPPSSLLPPASSCTRMLLSDEVLGESKHNSFHRQAIEAATGRFPCQLCDGMPPPLHLSAFQPLFSFPHGSLPSKFTWGILQRVCIALIACGVQVITVAGVAVATVFAATEPLSPAHTIIEQ